MMALIKIGREPTGNRDELGRRVDQVVWETGCGIDLRIPVKFKPAGIVMRDDMDHQISRCQRLESVVAERMGELRAKSVVLIHRDRESWRTRRSCLNDHSTISLIGTRLVARVP